MADVDVTILRVKDRDPHEVLAAVAAVAEARQAARLQDQEVAAQVLRVGTSLTEGCR